MEIVSFIFIIVFITLALALGIAKKQNSEQENNKSPDNGQEAVKRPGWIKRFWSYKEIRIMIAACAVIYFASLTLPEKLEFKITHNFGGNYDKPIHVQMNHNHDFGGNLHSPITLQLSDRGYPIKVEVQHR